MAAFSRLSSLCGDAKSKAAACRTQRDLPHLSLQVSPVLAISKLAIEFLARGVELAAALIIGLAALEATVKSLALFVRPGAPPEQKNQVRLSFARWLAVSLEFELAADILNTAVTPTWSDIEKLAAIAAIRTALNYFLEREIQQESLPAQRAAEDTTLGPDASPIAPPHAEPAPSTTGAPRRAGS